MKTWEEKVLRVDEWEQLFLLTCLNRCRWNRGLFLAGECVPAVVVTRTISSAPEGLRVQIGQLSILLADNFLSSHLPHPKPTHPQSWVRQLLSRKPSLVPGPSGVFLPPSPLSSLLCFCSKHILLCVVHISVHTSRLEYSTIIKTMTLEVGQAVSLSPSFLLCDLRQLLHLPRPQFRYPEATLITMPIE